MAWTQPTTPYFSVAEVVTASKMNVLSDDLRYLKGVDGPTTFEDRINVPMVSGTNGKGMRIGDASTQFGNLQALDVSSTSYLFFSVNRYYDGTNWQQLNSRRGGNFNIGNDVLAYYAYATSSVTPLDRMMIDTGGNVGFGTGSPQGKLHVYGGQVATAAFLILNASAVSNTLQTLTAAGAVSRCAYFLGIDRQNTSTGPNSFGGVTTPGSAFTYTNGDTITVSITAGGAITVQRTVGSAGTHDISMLVMIL